jgi:cation diffusion facilitator family transporter
MARIPAQEKSVNDVHLESWQHPHLFGGEKKTVEKRTLIVVLITFATMIAEIVFGWLTRSMALLADGWHMGTHAFALGVSLLAYVLARRFAADRSFAFGTWKIEILGAYSSAIVLGLVGAAMAAASLGRMFSPQEVHYTQAIAVALIGLAVNLLSAVILVHAGRGHRGQGHGSDHWREDLNLKSAYLHVLADALTSLLAVAALVAARHFGLAWLDPAAGLLGSFLILRWSFLLLRESSQILLQREMDSPLVRNIRARMEADGETKVSDMHLWKVAQGKYACTIALECGGRFSLNEYKSRLHDLPELVHVTIEVDRCR